MHFSHIRIIPLHIRDLSGAAKIDLSEQGIPAFAMLVPMAEREDAVAHIARNAANGLEVKVTTYGRTIAPISWDGMAEPITVRVLAAWNVVDTSSLQQTARTWQLPAQMTHIIRHGMGTRQFIESIRAENQAIFAGVTVVDENTIRIDLTEAQPITVSIVFLT